MVGQALTLFLEKQCDGTRESLKYLYTKTCTITNKQEELEPSVQWQDCSFVEVTEMWWDGSHDWSAALEGHRPWRKERRSWRGGVVALYVREQQGWTELCLGMGDEPDECLWDRISRQTNMGNIVMGVCYRQHDQEEVDEAFYRQL